MAVVEVERSNGIMVVRMNRPERMNALNQEVREAMAEAWNEFHTSRELEVGIITGTGRAFCAGEDLKETVARGTVERQPTRLPDLYRLGKLDKPVIAAVNGLAYGGGFMMTEAADLRIAVREAVFESSEAKRWLLGGYNHGVKNALPHAIATEMAFAFRFTAERLYEAGFLNCIVEPAALMPTAMDMARHLLSLPPASRVNTTVMMRAMRPQVGAEFERLAARLHEHGATSDRLESRRAFAEKRAPEWKGWNDPEDRFRTPKLDDGKNG